MQDDCVTLEERRELVADINFWRQAVESPWHCFLSVDVAKVLQLPSPAASVKPASSKITLFREHNKPHTVGTEIIADPEECYQELISEKILMFWRDGPGLE